MSREVERESGVERFLHTRVRLLGGHTIKIAPTEAGNPDRLVMLPGGHLHLVEVKSEQGKLSPKQEHWHSRAASLGVPVYVVYGRAGVLDYLRLAFDAMGPQIKQGRPRKSA